MTAIATLLVAPFLRIPSPYGGVIHIGDSAIFLASVLLGPFAGAFVGGVGHFFANFIFGPQIFAPWTLVIKGIMGFLVGAIAYRKTLKSVRLWLALICALVILLVGYFIAANVMFANEVEGVVQPAPLTFAISNAIQWGASVTVTIVLLPIVNKILGGKEL